MKDYVRELIRAADHALQGRNILREYLQARILGFMQNAGAMIPLAFHGGTCLRFLYRLPRYSEDLDFALEKAPERYDLARYARLIHQAFAKEGYASEIKLNQSRVVHSANIRFGSLLKEFGLSAHSGEILSVKIEVDTSPPHGAKLATTLVRRHVTLRLQHHDKSSLLAGKLHALLQRPYLKGRDIFDLLWYLSDPEWPSPNLLLLNHALKQTGWKGKSVTETNWKHVISSRIRPLSWEKVLPDVRSFLEQLEQEKLLRSKRNLLALLR